MTAVLLTPLFQAMLDNNGVPLSGGSITSYVAGTTTPLATFTDATGTVSASNPLTLDSAGRLPNGGVWGSGVYKFVLKNSAGTTISTVDSVTAIYGAGDMTKAVYDAANISQQLVGETAVQTLTNKTFAVASNTLNMAPITAALGADLALGAAGTLTAGPTIAQGSTGTWFVSGTVTVASSSAASSFSVRLWDGTTTVASAIGLSSGAGSQVAFHLSGYITSPAGNLRISVADNTTANGSFRFNNSGYSKDCVISAFRIA